MRTSSLAVIAFLFLPACTSRKAPADAPSPEAPMNVNVPAVPASSKWVLDPENSSVGFVCKHVFTNVRGMFQRPTGSLTLDDSAPGNSSVRASVRVDSITTGVEERDSHLKGPDFFDAAQFPLITFASTKVQKSSPTAYAVTGDLTLHKVTRPATLEITAPPPFQHAGGIRRGIEATLSVNRRDFGLIWDFPGEGTGVVVGDTIKITIDAELVLQGA